MRPRCLLAKSAAPALLTGVLPAPLNPALGGRSKVTAGWRSALDQSALAVRGLAQSPGTILQKLGLF